MSLNFYRELPEMLHFSDISKEKYYRDVPGDWLIVLTDVVNSTIAIEAGRYKDVNIAGALAAIALGNLYENLEHPFLFGGDGITFLIPGEFEKPVRSILTDTRRQVKELFDLELRVAMIPASEIYQQKKNLKLGRFHVSERYTQAILMGNGFTLAEALLKQKDQTLLIPENEPVTQKADFTGFTCRWQDIPSPLGETISLIIQFPANSNDQLFAKTLHVIENTLGSPEYYHPLRESALSPSGNPALNAKEAIVQTGAKSGLKFSLYMLKMKIELFVSKLAMRFKLPIYAKTYKLKDLKKYNVISSDFRKFDGSLKMVVTASRENRKKLISELEKWKKSDSVLFGYHISDRALLTCILHTGSTREVHFVDAADGGYALAAKMIKKEI